MQSKLVAAKDYHEVALDIPAFVPDQAALQKELDRLRNPYVTWKPGGAVVAGDMVRCSLRSALPRFQKDNIRFVAGSGMYNPTLEALAIGMQTGESRTATLPEGEVTLTVQAVQKRVVPALTDEMAAACKLPGGAHGGRVPALSAGAAAGQSRRTGRLDAGRPNQTDGTGRVRVCALQSGLEAGGGAGAGPLPGHRPAERHGAGTDDP